MKNANVLAVAAGDTPLPHREWLEKQVRHLRVVPTLAAAEAALALDAFDILLLDCTELDTAAITQFCQNPKAPQVVVLSANGSVNLATSAMRAGAYDFLIKPVAAERLLITLRNALDHARLQSTVATYRSAHDRKSYQGFIGSSLPMQAVYRMIESAASSKATVFITGESGTGKEVCAVAIHQQSPRAKEPFIALNCAAIPKDLIESEVFGHVKGAFTGATADRDGAARQAHGGSLFLDEICEMDLALQAKLLRFLQTGRFQPVGGSREMEVDVRIICATNRDPWAEVEAGRFREDLYYRLHVLPIALPPLRERGADVVEIARHLLATFTEEEGKGFTGFTPEAEQVLAAYDWPGNVRQMQNIIRNMIVMNEGQAITAAMIPPPVGGRWARIHAAPQVGASGAPAKIRPLAEVEKEAIEAAVAACGGNVPKAAALLEVSPSTIYRKQQSWQGKSA